MTPTPLQGKILVGVKSVELMYFLKIISFTPGYRYVEMMTKEVSSKFINITNPGQGFLC